MANGGKAGLPLEKHTWQSGSKTNGKLDSQVQPHQPPKQPNMRGSAVRKACNPHEVEVAGSNPTPASPSLRCPECGSQKLWKAGLRYLKDGSTVQRWLCRTCGFRFSESTANPKVKVNVSAKSTELLKSGSNLAEKMIRDADFSSKESLNGGFLFRGENVGPHVSKPHITILGKSLKGFRPYNNKHQVRVSEGETKNLVVETRQKRAAGATVKQSQVKTEQLSREEEGKLVEYAWTMKKQGYAEATIKTYGRCLNYLISYGARLSQPETVKEALARSGWSQTRKNNMIAAYTLYLKQQGLTWEPPFCRVVRKMPFIPNEAELDALIAGCGKKTSTFLQLLKETAMRVGEASVLKWIDVDLTRKIVMLNTPEKNGKPGIYKISNKLVAMLATLPKKTEYVFGTANKVTRGSVFYRERKRLAVKLGNPRLRRIGFHTFRHWKATMLYHETRDILLVKEFLRHRRIETTMLYIQLEKALFQTDSDEFNVKATKNLEEIQSLLEVGFEYVCEKDGLMFFRKRK